MEHIVEADFIDICKKIVAEGKDTSEWALIESDDMFQIGRYEGGFDADEEEFCFGVNLSEGEHWFQISLDEVEQIAKGNLKTVSVRPAE